MPGFARTPALSGIESGWSRANDPPQHIPPARSGGCDRVHWLDTGGLMDFLQSVYGGGGVDNVGYIVKTSFPASNAISTAIHRAEFRQDH